MNDPERALIRTARRVGVLQGLADLGADVQDQLHRQALAPNVEPLHQSAQIAAVDVLHHQEVLAVVTEADVEDLDDVAVTQVREDVGLGDQELDEATILRQMRQDPLDGDRLLEPASSDGLAAEDLGHATGADALD